MTWPVVMGPVSVADAVRVLRAAAGVARANAATLNRADTAVIAAATRLVMVLRACWSM